MNSKVIQNRTEDAISWKQIASGGHILGWQVRSSQTRHQTSVPCIARQILNHCTTREVPTIEYYWLQLPCPTFKSLVIPLLVIPTKGIQYLISKRYRHLVRSFQFSHVSPGPSSQLTVLLLYFMTILPSRLLAQLSSSSCTRQRITSPRMFNFSQLHKIISG